MEKLTLLRLKLLELLPRALLLAVFTTNKNISFSGDAAHIPKSKNLWYTLNVEKDKIKCQKSSVFILARIIISPPRPNCAFEKSFSHPQHIARFVSRFVENCDIVWRCDNRLKHGSKRCRLPNLKGRNAA